MVSLEKSRSLLGFDFPHNFIVKIMKKMNTILQTLSVLISLHLLIACTGNGVYTVVNDGLPASDSTLLVKKDTVISINIGSRIDPLSIQTQMLSDKGDTRYLIGDENQINIFDINNDTLLNRIPMENAGKINNYSGFSYINTDSILVYDYAKKILSLINTDGKVTKMISLHDRMSGLSPEALSISPILYSDNKVIMSGIPISSKTTLEKSDHISVMIDMQNGEVKTGAYFPDEYRKGYFGGVYYNTISHCIDNQDRIVYSFPASNYIYRYDTNLNFIDSLYMGSRYTKSIPAIEGSLKEILGSKENRESYFAKNHSYGKIIFNPYDSVYHRIAAHPSDSFPKPFSIITLSMEGKHLSETPILAESNSLISCNAFISPLGLLIQQKTPDENEIHFVIYEIKH